MSEVPRALLAAGSLDNGDDMSMSAQELASPGLPEGSGPLTDLDNGSCVPAAPDRRQHDSVFVRSAAEIEADRLFRDRQKADVEAAVKAGVEAGLQQLQGSKSARASGLKR